MDFPSRLSLSPRCLVAADSAEDAADYLAGHVAARIVRRRFSGSATDRHIHRLNSHPARAGESIPGELAGAGEESSLQSLVFGLHAYGPAFIDPAARLDIDLLA